MIKSILNCWYFIVVLAGSLYLVNATAIAHPLAPSLLELNEIAPYQIQVYWKTPKSQASRLRPILPADCHNIKTPQSQLEGRALVTRWTIDCHKTEITNSRVTIDGLINTVVLLRINRLNGFALHTLLSPEQPSLTIPQQSTRTETVIQYIVLGKQHILTGFDHLLFVLCLLLLIHRRQLIWTISSFTLGHSITLSLAIFNVIQVPTLIAETVIVLSLLILALELTRQSHRGLIRRYPAIIAGVFGLFHGLGFASTLAEIGLPQAAKVLALLSFNIGIELGQLCFIMIIIIIKIILDMILTKYQRRQYDQEPSSLTTQLRQFTPESNTRYTWLLASNTRLVPGYLVGPLSIFWLFEYITKFF